MQNVYLKFEPICEESIEKIKDGSRVLAITVANDKTNSCKIIFSSSNGYLFIGDILATRKLITIKFDNPVQSISCNRSGDLILITFFNKEIAIYDIDAIYSLFKSSDIMKAQEINLARLFYYAKHSSDITYAAINSEITKKDKVSFAFSDSAGNICTYYQQLFIGGTTTIISTNEPGVTNIKWDHNTIVWSTSLSIGSYDVYTKTKNLIFSSTSSKPSFSTTTNFTFLNQKTLCSSFGTYFLQTNFDPFNTMTINTGFPIVSMAISSLSTLQIVKKDEKMIFLIDNPSYFADEKLPLEFDQIHSNPTILATNRPEVFVCEVNGQIFSVTFLSWAERLLNTKTCESDFELICEQIDKMTPFPSDEERLSTIFTTINHFLQINSTEYALKICMKNLHYDDAEEWDSAIEEFDKFGRIQDILRIVPVDELREKTPRVCDILLSLIDTDMERFFHVFEILFSGDISKEVFSKLQKIDRLIESISNSTYNNPIFNIPLVLIYQNLGQHESALKHTMQGGYRDFFKYVRNYNMWKFCLPNVKRIFATYGDSFVEFLITEIEHFPPEDVIQNYLQDQASDNTNELLYRYMRALRYNEIPIPTRYNMLLISLYLKHRSPESLDILKTCKFDDAHDILKVKEDAHTNGMYREEAYILMKGGRTVDGLKIHLDFIKVPEEAVDYALRCGEQDVWKVLLQRSQEEPFRTYMLGNLLDLSNYLKFFDSIQGDLDSKAWSAVQNSLNEFKRQNNILKYIDQIVSRAAFERFETQRKKLRRGKRIKN
ncbi:hypothetical protein TVAG_299390 [Trichomonas vaginalis G3]|uniref:Uncharacterized protein n=1 Tax=Trichomonas vaginalis (strain ATCC PRA-98 / G3) TaxID=412133 RepID=A2EVR6_TRIV3|nr:regulation of SNARE complex assembly [Trichomonas vaginalis G3]EAY03276.1 hypothetical protein TVAG_299390 [Trichomonas vaginalis G3]KAI5535569.1 regulation of SNARE complex assembly [Trichomonas vaginalis G3]|eukprot:XP_001315499.1 hypothetical protein [Trichomonas vaginalis G3]